MTNYTIGADISKDHIDLYRFPDEKHLQVTNDRKGFAAILKWIGTFRVYQVYLKTKLIKKRVRKQQHVV